MDLKLWMDRDKDGKQFVQYTFYKKEVASKYTILKGSALSWKIKKSTLFQEALRRVNNVGPNQPWEETARHMTDYCHMLYLIGYSETERYSNVKGALDRMDIFDSDIKDGTRDSRVRTGDQIRKHKIEKGGLSPATWFLKGEIGSIKHRYDFNFNTL